MHVGSPGIVTKVYPYPRFCATVLQKSQTFRVRVWRSYRTFRSSGYGYGSRTELSEVPGIVARAYGTHKSSERVQTMLYPYPGYCGHGRTERAEVPGVGLCLCTRLMYDVYDCIESTEAGRLELLI